MKTQNLQILIQMRFFYIKVSGHQGTVMDNWRTRKMLRMGKSIRTRLLLPMLAIMVIQAVLFLSMLVFGGLFGTLKNNAFDILNENTDNSRLHLERELVHRWINTINSSGTINAELETVLLEEGRPASDIKTDDQLNHKIMDRVTGQMIDLLHRSDGTGVFVILDGPFEADARPDQKGGVYVRDLDPSAYADDNSDLSVTRGLPFADKPFAPYYTPLNRAKEAKAEAPNAYAYGYMSLPFSISQFSEPVITYSVPLITADGTVVGVIGMEMSAAQVQQYMSADDLDSEGKAVSLLGVWDSETETVKQAVADGALYEDSFGDLDSIVYEKEIGKNIYMAETKGGEIWYASVCPLDIYDQKTSLEQDEWVVVGMIRSRDILHVYNQIKGAVGISLLIPFLFSVIAVFVSGKIVTDPIRRLIKELRLKSNSGSLSLSRTHINEIDELTEAIEILNTEVEKSASKLSSILEHANVSIGVYEYRGEKASVFCSRSLYELLGWEKLEELYAYLRAEEFRKRMSALRNYAWDEENQILEIPGNPSKWIRVTRVQMEHGRELGVLSDVSSDVAEKRKLERERDYDILTGIYNRRAFKEKATELLDHGSLKLAAVVMWDLDNLKYINDTYGHDEGDHYISAFANHLKSFEREGAMVSRYSGDEFMTVLLDRSKESIRRRVKDFMLTLHEQTIVVKGGYQMPLRVSGGIAWYPDDGTSFEVLSGYADFAMYMVKHSVKGIVMEFDQDTYSDNSFLLEGREELNHLLETKEVDFAFQPIVARDGTVYGHELLMRPRLKHLKDVTELITLARAQAKLSQIEELTWDLGFRAFDREVRAGHAADGSKFFINSIANVVLGQELMERWEQLYPEYLSRMVIEVTEGEPIDEVTMNLKKKTAKRWGAMMALDDYGAGYSSQNALLQMDPDVVKIDMNLIRNVDTDVSRQRLLQGVVAFTKQEGSLVLAEGVETAEELNVLMDMGIDMFQGFYIGRPELEIRPVDPYIIRKIRSMYE